MGVHLSNPADDVVALSDVSPIPGLGFLPVNAYLVRAQEPLLVDTGLPASRTDFLQALCHRSSQPICAGSISLIRTVITPAA